MSRVTRCGLARLVLFALLLGSPLSGPGASQAATGIEPKNVLLLNSYHPGYNWNVSLLEGLHEVLDRSDMPLHIRYEYMDAKHDVTDAFVDELRDLYRRKYRKIRFDVIIASDNDAFNFLRRYRDELFPGAAVVFCGVNGFQPSWLADFPKVTGTGEHFDLQGTIELALRLHRSARHLVLVGGVDTTSRINAQLVRDLMPRFPQVTLLDYSGLNIADLAERLRTVPRDAVLIYLSYCLTPDGTRMAIRESLSLVRDLSGLPMYSAWAYQLSDGMVGGKMLRAEDQGRTAAQLAMRILHGEDADAIPVLDRSATYPMFDAERLRHFGIARSSLPQGAIVLNEEPSLWGQYRGLVIGATAFMLYQSLMIVWLLFNVRQRKKAEEALKRDQALRLQLEEQLFHAQKLEAIDTFAGGIAHDFNNILESISGCCELVLDDLPPDDPLRTDVLHALRAAQRGKALNRRILDFSRRVPTSMKPLHLAELVQECLDMLRPLLPAGVRVETFIDGPAPILGDADQLIQAILNLCINAAQAMRDLPPEQPRVLRFCLDQVSPAPGFPEGAVRLRVSDTGHGIAPEHLARIFDPFFTTRAKGSGTGLGLAVTQGIVQRHKGSIVAENTPEGGASFTLLLPPASAALALQSGEIPLSDALPKGGDEHLLLVGALSDQAALAQRLEKLGYQVTLVASEEEALALFDSPAPEAPLRGPVALALLSDTLGGQDALALAESLRRRKPLLPMLLLTTLDPELLPSSEQLAALGIHAVLRTPLDVRRLAHRIRLLISVEGLFVPHGRC